MAFIYSPADAIPIPTEAEPTVPEDMKTFAGPSEPSEETQTEVVADPAASSAHASADANVPEDLDPIFHRVRVSSPYGLSSKDLASRAVLSETESTVQGHVKSDSEHAERSATETPSANKEAHMSDALPGPEDPLSTAGVSGIVERVRNPYYPAQAQGPYRIETIGELPTSSSNISGRTATANMNQINIQISQDGRTKVYSSETVGEWPRQTGQGAQRAAAAGSWGRKEHLNRASSKESGAQNNPVQKSTTPSVPATHKMSTRMEGNIASGNSTQKNGIFYYTEPPASRAPGSSAFVHESHQDEELEAPQVTMKFKGNVETGNATQRNIICQGPLPKDIQWGNFTR